MLWTPRHGYKQLWYERHKEHQNTIRRQFDITYSVKQGSWKKEDWQETHHDL